MEDINKRTLDNPFSLEGNTTIITGAGGAIGGVTAKIFARCRFESSCFRPELGSRSKSSRRN